MELLEEVLWQEGEQRVLAAEAEDLALVVGPGLAEGVDGVSARGLPRVAAEGEGQGVGAGGLAPVVAGALSGVAGDRGGSVARTGVR